MNIKKLIEGASRNLVAKVICFVCALFIYVFHQVSMLDKKTFVVPLELVCDGLVAPMTPVPGYVKISVRAQTEAMPSITAAEIKASVNVSRYAEAGEYAIPVTLEFSDSLLLVDPLEVAVKPESVRLTLDKRGERYIPVMAAISGEPKHGYQVKSVSVSPSTVKAVGPEEILRRTKFVYTGKVNVNGAAANFASEVGLDNINALVDVLPESEFKVSIEIEPAPFEAAFEAVSPKIVALRPGLQIDGAVPPVSFKLAGTAPALENFKLAENTVSVNCRTVSESGTYELPLVFSVPSGVSVVEKSVEMVSLVVSERKQAEPGTADEDGGGHAEGLPEAPDDAEFAAEGGTHDDRDAETPDGAAEFDAEEHDGDGTEPPPDVRRDADGAEAGADE